MNVNKMSKAELVALWTKFDAQLVERTAELRAARQENQQLRQLNAEWAAESARLKRELLKLKGRSSANHRDLPGQSYREAAIAYCAKHGCASVTPEQLRAAG